MRGAPRLFFVNGLRNEGWAFYLEEMILQAGMLEDRPKTREIDFSRLVTGVIEQL